MEKFIAWGNKEYGTNFKLKDMFLFDHQCDPLAPEEEKTIK
jgi:hypothetical protein